MSPPANVHTHAIRGFFWDHPDAQKPRAEHNVYHMLDKHGVTSEEVEEVIEGAPVLLKAAIPKGQNPVYGVVGLTAKGRLLEIWGIVFLDPPYADMWRTITAIDADADARRRYEKERGAR